MRPARSPAGERRRLIAIRTAHTVVWAFFAGCVFAAPVFSWKREHGTAALLLALVFVEVLVLLVNRRRCPMTDLAARYTEDRRANFDIYLPEWLARHNQTIFGTLYLADVLFALFAWRAT